MSKDEILQALHILAMGRARHPLHEQLAEKLEAVFAGTLVNPETAFGRLDTEAAAHVAAAKRTRKAKAE
jgi:hypothetical protein